MLKLPKNKMTRKAFYQDQHGGILIFTVLSLFALLAIIGLAIEFSRITTIRTKAQYALDAAILSASTITTAESVQVDENGNPVLDEDVARRVNEYFNANFPTGYMGSTPANLELSFDTNTGSLSATVDINSQLMFGSFLGTPDFNSSVSSESRRYFFPSRVEIALVLDHTTSLCADPVDATYQVSCQGYADLRQAVNDFTSIINSAAVASSSPGGGNPRDNIYYSYVAFNHAVKLNNAVYNGHPQAGYLPNSHGLKNATPVITATPPPDPATYTEIVGGKSLKGTGSTNIAMGAYWGWATLRSDNLGQTVLTSGDSAQEITPATAEEVNNPDNPAEKYMILLTDGNNELYTIWGRGETCPLATRDGGAPLRSSCVPGGGDCTKCISGTPGCTENGHVGCFCESKMMYVLECERGENITCGKNGNPECAAFSPDYNADKALEKICEEAKENGIIIYTIIFDRSSSVPNSVYEVLRDRAPETQKIMKACASNNNYFLVSDGDRLRQVFRQIAASLIQPKVFR